MMSLTVLALPQRFKRLLQAMTLAIAIVYMTLVLYQSTYGYPGMQLQPTQHFSQLDGNELSVATTTIVPPAPSSLTQKEQLQLLQEYTSSQPAPLARGLHATPTHAASAVSIGSSPPAQTTVIIRKDIRSFNFSDIEVSERPTAALLNDLARRSRNGELLHDLSQRAVTATPQPPITELDDIFISVKTTKNYHDTRLALIIKTWFQLARDQTWFFTDTDDHYYQEKTKGHLINTKCSQGHFRKALCCKMSAELDIFLQSGKKWFCHFDDDNYVNVPRLVKLLDEYSPTVDWYLGKPSISSPLEIHLDSKNTTTNKKITFWFATGGAGFCLSRALTLKMLPIAGGGKFISIGDKIRFPDDVTMGFIIEHLLKVPLTVVDNFHSHLEPMEFIRSDTFQDQVSFSYAHMKNQWNVIKVDGFDLKTDPKRFYSLHCQLFPYFSFCPPR
ncbi:fringe glycosyltransferase [Scaptodrosophila lebanonensis]|uniref:O-fucosylpeptide 3-beta-N-acetylglucosaminyltransferase n=1 Tax=Drosophila lebanonensis TaxID=7225 RepID=A0A6J2UAC9_DROLE|nr:fringe glycosyltransferase [Scaptodrosophila lebanonensis]